MKKVNGFTVYEGTDKCALDEYSEQLAQELKEEFEKNKYDDSEVKQDIQDLQSEQETQNTAIENNTEELELLKNNLPDPVTTEQSEEITVQDAMNYYGSLDVSGNSTQATRSGKNKLYLADVAEATNAHGITYSVEDGVITLNGTSIRAHYINFNSSKFDLPAGDYTMSGKELAGSCSGSSGKQLNNEDNSKNLFNGGTMTSTVSNTLENDETGVHLALYIGSTAVFNNYKFEIQLEEGTTATEYEKYGAMPSPDYPSKIKNCGDNINRFDKSTIKTGYYLDSTGAEVANTNYAITDYIEVEENENYTYQGLNITASFGAKGAYYNSSKEFISPLDLNAEDTTILIPENVKYVKFTIRTTNNNQDTFKIEKGSIATPYSPYNCGSVDIKVENEDEEKIITFPLTEGQRLHLGDYLASDGVHHVKQTCVFDGTENVLSGYLDETIDSFRIVTSGKYNQMLSYQTDDKCSHFKNLGHTPAWGRQANTFALSSEGYLYIFFEKNKITSETEAKNWIAEQYNNGTPLTAEGTLEEEYVEPYTEEQQAVYNELQRLILYKGYNYITCIDETKCKMKLTYRPDNNSKIKSLEERVAALENSEVTA